MADAVVAGRFHSVLGTPLTEPQDDHLMPGTTHPIGRGNPFEDKQAQRLREGDGNLPPNFLSPCFLSFRASTAVLRVAPVLDDLNDKADGVLDAKGQWVGIVFFDCQRSNLERLALG